MSEENEIFHGLKDSGGDGLAPDARKQGESVSSGQSQIVLSAEDASNNLELLQVQAEDTAVSTKAQAILAGKDEFGAIQYLPMKLGALLVNDDGSGSIVSNNAQGTTASVGSYETAVTLTLALNKIYSNLELSVSSFKDCTWKIEYIDDAGGGGETITIMHPGEVRTGAGSYSVNDVFKHFTLNTNGATAVQQLKISVKQRAGTGSDFNASVALLES